MIHFIWFLGSDTFQVIHILSNVDKYKPHILTKVIFFAYKVQYCCVKFYVTFAVVWEKNSRLVVKRRIEFQPLYYFSFRNALAMARLELYYITGSVG